MIKHGDLLFSLIGSDSNAISAVTEGYRGARLNHMGIVLDNQWGTFVLEAFPPEVRVTQIDVFIRRSSDPVDGRLRYIAARLDAAHRHLLSDAVEYGLKMRNLPYDDLYLTDSSALYCSELIVDMFKHANGGLEFFVERPMSFRDLVTGQIHPVWIEYYKKFGMAVPEGKPGSNPGDLSRDSRVEVFEVVGPPAGYSDA
jgi:hypothetical protein